MVNKNHIVGTGNRNKICAQVPKRVKDTLKEETRKMAGSYSQGVILTQALREYLEISELADEMEMIQEVSDTIELSENPSPLPFDTYDYEMWSENHSSEINTRIPQLVHQEVKEHPDTTGLVVTNAILYYFDGKNEIEHARQFIRDVHDYFDTDSSEEEIKIQNLKRRDDANKRRVVIDYLESSPLNRVTVDELEEILIKEADYAPSTAETIAESVVGQLTPLPTAMVDWKECRDEDIEQSRINMKSSEYTRRYNNRYNYLVDPLEEGYCVGDVVDAVREDLDVLFDWEFNRGGRRETFARHCLVEATEFDEVTIEDVEEVVPRKHHDLIGAAEGAVESRWNKSDWETYQSVMSNVLEEVDEINYDTVEKLYGISEGEGHGGWTEWFNNRAGPVETLASIVAIQSVTDEKAYYPDQLDEFVDTALELEFEFE